MATISISTPSDGQTIDAADVNSPLNVIVAAINGNLDDDNIKTGANINGTKLLANSIPPTAGDDNMRAGWNNGILAAPNTVIANGGRNYSLVFNTVDYTSKLSNGMRLKMTRTVTAPTQCTDLESGSSQYYNKTSPAAMTFTDDFVVSAWIKLESYAAATIASRWNGTSGWRFRVLATGQIELTGFNAGAANTSNVTSYQSVPLNKWVHVAAQLDMSAFTATTTTSYVMLDGLDVTATVARGGTNPTALIQAGNLEIGGDNGGTNPFDGKLAQVAIYNAKVTQATILASINQTLSGSETSLISAYSFNNVITDLNTSNANNLTAQGSAVATSVDSPFAGGANASAAFTAGTIEFGEVFNVSFSTNTTVVVQMPEGYVIPTSGGVSAIAYSPSQFPLGWPGAGTVLAYAQVTADQTAITTQTDALGLAATVYVPAGRKIRITADAGGLSASANTDFVLYLMEGAAQLQFEQYPMVTASKQVSLHPTVTLWPTTGSHTYKLQVAAANSSSLKAAATNPASFRVELV